MKCIDLRPWAKERRYRFRYEEGADKADAWCVEVLCRRGLVYTFGGNTLLAYANARAVKLVEKVEGAEHHQSDGNNEVFKFPLERLDEVAAILRPKRLGGPAILSNEHREKLKPYAFQAGNYGQDATIIEE